MANRRYKAAVSKYGVRLDPAGKAARTRDGILFDSKKEAAYYDELKIRRDAGEIDFFLRQPAFDIGGGTKWSADFLEFHSDGSVHIVDVKGRETTAFIKARKQVEALYPIEIEVKR